MNLYLTDGTVLTADDGDFILAEYGNSFFMSDSWPAVILRQFPSRPVDAEGTLRVQWP